MNLQQSIPIELPEAAHAWARLFSSKQADVPRGKQVYLNTLSVFAVDDYLQSFGIRTNLEGSNSWYPSVMTPENSADLELFGIGKVECRLVLPTQTELVLPNSARFDRIAYLAVRLDEFLESVSILGYLPHEPNRDFNCAIDLSALQPIDNLTNYLEEMLSLTKLHEAEEIIDPLGFDLSEAPLAEVAPVLSIESIASSTEKLKKIGESGWQDLKKLWADVRAAIGIEGTDLLMPDMAFRRTNSQGASLTFGANAEDVNLPTSSWNLRDGFIESQVTILILELEQDYQDSDKVRICIEVKSANETLLPEGICLEIFSPSERLGNPVISQLDNIIIKRKFTINRGILLEIRVTFNNECITKRIDV
jgi:Protein of unknown function (DUF1822)